MQNDVELFADFLADTRQDAVTGADPVHFEDVVDGVPPKYSSEMSRHSFLRRKCVTLCVQFFMCRRGEVTACLINLGRLGFPFCNPSHLPHPA